MENQEGVSDIRLKDYQRYIFLILLAGLTVLSYLTIKGFISDIVVASLVAYIFYPVYNRIKRHTGRKRLSAFLSSAVLILLLLIPMAFMLNAVSRQAYQAYQVSKDTLGVEEIFNLDCEGNDALICRVSNRLESVGLDTDYYLSESLKKTSISFVNAISEFILSIPGKVLDLFVIIFMTYYLFVDGRKIIRRFWKFLPIKKEHQEVLIKRFNDVTHAVIFGSLITAAVQGFLGGIGFYAVGLPAPILWGMLMAFTSLIPFLGTGIVWAPASIYLVIMGVITSDMLMVGKGIGLFVYGMLIVGTVDNLIKPKIIGGRGKIHPAVVLIGVLGGLRFFGILGLVIGPIILALFLTLIKTYEEEYMR